jgi:predicted ATPase/DNA-binding SARP family transcriptional activator
LVPIPAGKTSGLLVHLALEAGALVRTERLVEDLWAASALSVRPNTLQAKVAKLRRSLGDPAAIVTGVGGYKLAVESSDVDALAVLEHVATAAHLVDAGEDRDVADLCALALGMFRGEVLQAAGDGDWVTPHRTRLEEARLGLMETRFSARLRLGEVADVIGELVAAVAAYPFQEALWEMLITALYRAGRQAEALATYQRVREQLADEMGLEPGPRLQQVEREILAQSSSLDGPRHGTRSVEPVGNLPSMSTELVGREAEVTAVCELLDRNRLVEIIGPGGIGKTAVAIAAGRRLGSPDRIWTGGVWLVRLDTAVTANDVLDTVIAALNVTGGEAALLERVKGAASLLILDNCEHLVDAAAALAVRLLDAAAGLWILCTSQLPLDVDGEALYELAPLALADAVELFTRRADIHRVNRDSSHTDEDVRDLCRSLDGLPLAIELAAARTRTLSIGEITRRLDDRFSVLRDPTSRRPERRRALKATIRWSYDLLFPDDQRGLWALATFAGGASLPAVEFVVKALDVPAGAAIDVVGRLARRSLVIVDGESPAGAVRYRLLDSIRAFALEVLADAGLSAQAHGAHAAWFAAAAASSTQGVRSSGQAEHLGVARTERANIDAALAWSSAHDPLLGLQVANGFGWAWVVLGDTRGAQRILAALDATAAEAPVRERAIALLLAAWIEASTGDLEPARAHVAAASELADSIGDVDLQARASYYMAYVVSHHGEFGQALALTDRSRALYERLERPWDQVANGLFAARAAISSGDHGRSIDAVDHVQRWLRTVDDPWLHVRGDAVLGELARMQHRFDDAVVHLGRAADASRRLGFLQTEAYQLSSLGRAQCQAGDYGAGSATLELAIEKAEATGDVRLAALAQVHLGRVLRAVGQVARARAVLEATTGWHRAAGGGEQAALGECLLAALDAEEGVAGAEGRLAAILDGARRDGNAHVEVFALDALARLGADAGDTAGARELLGEADRRMEAASDFITDFDRTDARSVRLTTLA